MTKALRPGARYEGRGGGTYTSGIDILLVCTANQCRSPMAEGLLRAHLAQAGVPASVGSAGLLPGGSPATSDAIAVMAARGLDIGRHRSRTINPQFARNTPLVIGMTRQHVREAVVTYGAPIERTFTLKELVRRGEKAGRRAAGETVSAWLARVGAGRQVSDLIGDDEDDDVADPVGRPREEYEYTVAELDDLLSRLVRLLVGASRPGAAPARDTPAGGAYHRGPYDTGGPYDSGPYNGGPHNGGAYGGGGHRPYGPGVGGGRGLQSSGH